jgi:AbrB family looped-hinge helix DNA binding protein
MLYKAKIIKGGKVSIPSACRKYLNIKDGEEIVFQLKNGEIAISPLKLALKKVREVVDKYHTGSLVDKLKVERNEESKNE